ncbi:MAG: hypothetical protein AABX37_01600 [Nanoarchaeota archaeon]
MTTEVKTAHDDLETYQKRIELLIGARFSESKNIQSAVETQDNIRKKIGAWEGTKEIRRWRQQN